MKVEVLKCFKMDGKVYGEYYIVENNSRTLAFQNGDDIKIIAHFLDRPIEECIARPTQEVVDLIARASCKYLGGMTREEAIKWLNNLYVRADITDEYGDMEDMHPYEEAVNIAIKALEQEPFDIETYCKEHFCVMVDKDVWEKAEKALKQEPILDKIRDEIMQLGYEVEVVDYDHNDITRIKKAHWIIREEVLWIIDKYKKAVRIDDKNIDNKL